MSGVSLANQTTSPEALAAALAALERGGAITPTSLDLEDPEMSYEAWMGLGELISRVRKASSWWIGDWYIFGGIAFGEDRAAAAEAIAGVSPHTLATIVRTCMYVPKSRRRLELPFSVHTEISRLMPEEQEQWLDKAMTGDGRNHWTREQLRDQIRDSQKRFTNVEPVWDGAIEMKRVATLEEIAREIYSNAQPGEENTYIVESELIARLGVVLGEEQE